MCKKRVLLIIDNLGGGGAQRQLALLAERWVLSDVEFSICTFHQYTDDIYSDRLIRSDIHVEHFHLPGKIERILVIRQYILEIRPHLIFSYLDSANILCGIVKMLSINRYRLVVFDRHGLTNKYHLRDFFKYCIYGFVANRILVNSSDIYNKVRIRAPWLHNRLELHWNSMSEIDSFDLEQKASFFATNKVSTRLICAASYRELKNAHGLINALAKIYNQKQFKFTLDWYGNAEKTQAAYYDSIRHLVESYGLKDVVSLNQFSSNIQSEIMKSDFIVLPSYFEGCPNFLIEGMICGKPVLASNTSSNPTIVPETGGFLFDPYDIDSIVSALQEAFQASQEERKIMGAANRDRAEKMFSAESNLSNLYDLLKKELE